MNRPCDQCGRIVTVPDIPLPSGYTQKCTACGFANRVGEETLAKPLHGGKSFPSTSEDSWDASLDSTFSGDEPPVQPSQALEDRFRELEARLRADLERAEERGIQHVSPKPMPQITHPDVATLEILIGTKNTAIYHKCFSILNDMGYRVEGASDLNKAYEMMKRLNYQILVLDQQFLNSGEAGRLVFQHIRETPADIRRAQSVFLLTPGIATSEPQVFYQWGMDLNIHPRDLDRLGILIKSHLAFKERILAC